MFTYFSTNFQEKKVCKFNRFLRRNTFLIDGFQTPPNSAKSDFKLTYWNLFANNNNHFSLSEIIILQLVFLYWEVCITVFRSNKQCNVGNIKLKYFNFRTVILSFKI